MQTPERSIRLLEWMRKNGREVSLSSLEQSWCCTWLDCSRNRHHGYSSHIADAIEACLAKAGVLEKAKGEVEQC